jgi:DNA polymerase III alpha subunit (gram-positive type)
MLILGLDFETTGGDPKIHRITEVGMATWDTDLRQPIKIMGYPVNPGPDAIWEVEVLEKFPQAPELSVKYGVDDLRGAKQFFLWYQAAEIVCAHNGIKFDKGFTQAWADRHNFESDPNKLWIDTMTDLPLPKGFSRKLPYMPIDHKLYPNPFPHRAAFDTVSMLMLLDQYPLDKVLELARSPMVVVKALVTFHNNELAKKRGYHAEYKDGKFVMWFREMKELFVEQEREECTAAGFSIEVIK